MPRNELEETQDGEPFLKKMRVVHKQACDDFNKAQEDLMLLHHKAEEELDRVRESNVRMDEELRRKDVELRRKDGDIMRLKDELEDLRVEMKKMKESLLTLAGDDVRSEILHAPNEHRASNTANGRENVNRPEAINPQHLLAVDSNTELEPPVRVKRPRSSSVELLDPCFPQSFRSRPNGPPTDKAVESWVAQEKISTHIVKILLDDPGRKRCKLSGNTRWLFCRICRQRVCKRPGNFPAIENYEWRQLINEHFNSHPGATNIINGMEAGQKKRLKRMLAAEAADETIELSGGKYQAVFALSCDNFQYSLPS